MFCKFFSEDKCNDFYNRIKHTEYTIAILQEFLFYNRKSDNIMKHISEFFDIIDRNDPKKLKTDKNNQIYL